MSSHPINELTGVGTCEAYNPVKPRDDARGRTQGAKSPRTISHSHTKINFIKDS
ncbi:hypothetical protein MA16_Dca021279 [Dendrobium catenatum]|uniref:Uncharacterized protein n=1 Tax=Dendrobium catenatum TaxID=906689 RepID=A0A2I0XHE2_9ASPA|nr:hypothetical protein MA16_Dca021279 [Dendrobium catenatum]